MDTFQESFRQALEILVQHWEQEKSELYARITDLEQYADVSIIKSLSDELHVLKMENTTLKRRLKNDDTRSYLSESIRAEPSIRTVEQSVPEPSIRSIEPLVRTVNQSVPEPSIRSVEPSVRTVNQSVPEPSIRSVEPSVRTVNQSVPEPSMRSVETSNARKQRGRPVVVKSKKNTEIKEDRLEQEADRQQKEQEADRQQKEQEADRQQKEQEADRQQKEQERLEEADRQQKEQERLEEADRQQKEQARLEEQERLEEVERQQKAQEQERIEAERSSYKAVKIKGVQYYTFKEQIYDADYNIVGRIEQNRARFNKSA